MRAGIHREPCQKMGGGDAMNSGAGWSQDAGLALNPALPVHTRVSRAVLKSLICADLSWTHRPRQRVPPSAPVRDITLIESF